ncbi:unnamed protein product [Paramecium pentaurelia]|uniref:Uncharacterized protein n=1 Tax=Paramecium pentaurelia TaxID=43138 RepID=A0A8S1TNK1_9CILI|nr:unnamed protein product [Paramecium pentaurelia]
MRHIILLLIIQCFASNIDVQISYIDAPLINIHWCSDTVLALTSKGSVYRSDDRGRQWTKMSEIFHRKALIQLEDSDERVGIVNNLVPSPVDKSLVLFTGTDQIAWISLDCGKTITAVNAGKQLREYQFHPLEKDWIIASAWKQCGSDELLAGTPCVSYKELLLSQDTGITWHQIATYVNQFTWGVKNKEMAKYTPKERILASFEPQGKGHQSISNSTTVPFERVLGKEVGGSLQKLHEANGVEFELNAGVKRIGGVGQVQRVDLLNGKSLQADLVILGTGIQPNNKLAKDQLKISPNGGIETDVFLKAAKNVYASGDISSYPYWVTGEHVRIEHQNEAVRQGYVAALNILGRPTPLTDVPFFWTRQWDRTLAYSGVGQGFDEVIVDGDLSQQKFVAYYARKGRVVASASMNTPNAQMIISEALRLNVMPSAEDLKEKKVNLDDIKKIVLSKGSSCHCKRAGQCQSQL